MNIKISSDSTLDLSPELIKKYDIGVVPLSVIKDGKPYRDLVDITPAEIFEYVDGGGEICTTSGVNFGEYTDVFTEYLKSYDAVIHINLSGEMSTCYQNARLAASELENVYVVDSRNLSSAQGLVVLKAAELAEAGMEPAEIYEKLNRYTGLIEASFILDRLDYLHKGGRCSGVAAFGANLFNIKPSIEVVDGKMVVSKKYRGLFDRCARQYILDRLAGRDDIDTERLLYTRTVKCPEKASDAGRAAIEEAAAGFDAVHETFAGCVISSHCGPHCLGVLFARKG